MLSMVSVRIINAITQQVGIRIIFLLYKSDDLRKIELSFATIDITPLLVTCIGNYLIVPYIGFLHQNIQEDSIIVLLYSSEKACYINSCSV